MTNLTNKEFWTKMNRMKPKGKSHFELGKILDKYLNSDISVGDTSFALEIGCVPGTILAHICKNYNYYPVGVDFDEHTFSITSQHLMKAGLDKFEIIRKDFTKWKTDYKFDLVTSFGFIEHFDNPEEIVKKHIDLMTENGKVIIGIPNFSGFNGWLHKLVDKPNLEKHNTKIMNLDFFRKIARENNLKINYLGYYGSWHFQWGYGRRETANIFQKGIYAFLKIISKVTRPFIMKNKLSNYIMFIAEK